MTSIAKTNVDWSAYSRLEARMALRNYHFYGLVALMVIGLLSSLLLPLMPQTVYDLLTKGFQLKNWTEVIVFNDYITIFALVFWLGIFDLFRVTIVPTEERYLDIYLSKPLPRARYLMSRLLPTFGLLVGLLAFCLLFYIAKIALINGTAAFDIPGFVVGILFTSALTIFLLAVANYIFLFLKEIYHAILVSFGLWLIPVLPTMLLMYRPDLLQTKPQLKLFLYPANLLWFSQHAFTILAVGLPLLLLGTAGLLYLAVRRMENADLL